MEQVFSTNSAEAVQHPQAKKKKKKGKEPWPNGSSKLNIKCKIAKLLEENTRENL